jgi:hypothetical protein
VENTMRGVADMILLQIRVTLTAAGTRVRS